VLEQRTYSRQCAFRVSAGEEVIRPAVDSMRRCELLKAADKLRLQMVNVTNG
jgi:hypothetical protein